MQLCRSGSSVATLLRKDPGAGALPALHSQFARLLASPTARNQAKPWSPCRTPQHRPPALLPPQRAVLMDPSALDNKEQEPSVPQEASTAAPAAAATTAAAAGPGPGKRKAEKEGGRKLKKTGADPKKIRTSQLTGEIAQHAKHNRLQPAMAAFRAAVEEGLSLSPSLCNTLLYLSCGGNNWEAYARGQPIPQPDASSTPLPAKEELIEATAALWAHMQQEGVRAEHATYTSLARIEAIKGNAAGALNWAKASVSADQSVQLRLFHPALVSLMLRGDVQSMLEVDRLIASFGKEQLDLTEYEYAALLEGLTQHGSWVQVAELLHRVGKELNQLSPSTLAILEAYFSGLRSAEAFDGPSLQLREAAAQQQEQHLLRVRQQQQEREREQRQLAKERFKQQKLKQAAWREGRQGGPRAAEPEAAAPEEPGTGEGTEPAAAAGSPPRHTGSPTAALLPEAGAAVAESEPVPGPGPAHDSAAAATAPSPSRDRGSPEPEAAAAALPEEERRRRRPWLGYGGATSWRVSSNVAMDASSGCLAAGGLKPLVVDLEEEEWASFSAGIAALAMKLEQRQSDFQHYMDWYQRNGPYDILIDGANVAFYGQNREGGGFNWKQIMSMVQLVQQQYPDKRVLLMLHNKRVHDASAHNPRVAKFLDALRATKSFYFTPPGSNDDWYWLYATVQARSGGLLVSNDELRDHIWSLLRPKHFLKWKSRHIAHYTFVPSDSGSTWLPALSLPNAYTECVQELEDGSWVFPCTDKTWLCVSPAPASRQ